VTVLAQPGHNLHSRRTVSIAEIYAAGYDQRAEATTPSGSSRLLDERSSVAPYSLLLALGIFQASAPPLEEEASAAVQVEASRLSWFACLEGYTREAARRAARRLPEPDPLVCDRYRAEAVEAWRRLPIQPHNDQTADAFVAHFFKEYQPVLSELYQQVYREHNYE
jgi:hypothetical protein